MAKDGHGEVGSVVPGPQVPRGEAVLHPQAGIFHRLVERVEAELSVNVEAGHHDTAGTHVGSDPRGRARLLVG